MNLIGEAAMRVVEKVAAAMQIRAFCESPIEVDLGAAIIAKIGEILEINDLKLEPQFEWHRYRMDFAITRGNQIALFIECDGRDFHSSSEQLANDRRKDAAAEQAGIPLLRFSGSEIWRFTDGCVERVLDYLVRRGAV